MNRYQYTIAKSLDSHFRQSIPSEGKEIVVDGYRGKFCLQGFHELFESKQLCDIVLAVDDREYSCHKALLAASSDYFRGMFTNDVVEKHQKVVTINGVDSVSMEQVLNCLYTGKAKLTSANVQNLLSAANLFNLVALKTACAAFMAEQLDLENSIGIHFFAKLHDCARLAAEAFTVISENFEQLSSTTEFFELSPEHLVEIVKSDDIDASEEVVFEACLGWLKHEYDARKEHILPVFQHVRYAIIDDYYMFDDVKNNSLLQHDTELQRLFDEAVHYKLLKSRWMESDLRFEPRLGCSQCRVIVYTAYLDDEKKQVLQVYRQKCDEVPHLQDNILNDLPHAVENPAVLVTSDNDLYVAGGDGKSDAVHCLLGGAYDDDESYFEEKAAMLVPRKQFCLVQVDSYILAVGGCNNSGNLCTVSSYSEKYDEWKDVCSMPVALRCFCAVAYHGYLYVFGGEAERFTKKTGRGRKELSKQTFRYDPREDKWDIMAEMNTPRGLAGCTIYKNKIYVIGGFGTITESWVKDKSPELCLCSVEVYEPDEDKWSEGPSLPNPLCAMGVVKYDGSIYVMGGENDEGVSSKVCHLNKDATQWMAKSSMPVGVTEITIQSAYTAYNIDVEKEK